VGAKASLEGVVGRIVDEEPSLGRMGKNEESDLITSSKRSFDTVDLSMSFP